MNIGSQNYYFFLIIWSFLFLAILIALKYVFLSDNKSPSQVIFWSIFVWCIIFISFQPLWSYVLDVCLINSIKLDSIFYRIQNLSFNRRVYIYKINLLIYLYYLILLSYFWCMYFSLLHLTVFNIPLKFT